MIAVMVAKVAVFAILLFDIAALAVAVVLTAVVMGWDAAALINGLEIILSTAQATKQASLLEIAYVAAPTFPQLCGICSATEYMITTSHSRFALIGYSRLWSQSCAGCRKRLFAFLT